MMPVEFAGETVITGEIAQPAFVLVAVVDDAHHAVRTDGFAVGAGEPAAGVFEPESGVGVRVGANAILDAIADAAAVVALLRAHDCVEAGLQIVGVEELRKCTGGGDRLAACDRQNSSAFALQVSASLWRSQR